MSDCCGDAHAELEWMKMAFESLGIETRVKEDSGAKEISYYNIRAMKAEEQLARACKLLDMWVAGSSDADEPCTVEAPCAHCQTRAFLTEMH